MSMSEEVSKDLENDAGRFVNSAQRIATQLTFQMFLQARSLPKNIDDAERDFGPDIYDQMLNDPYIAGPLSLLLERVLEKEPTVVPNLPKPIAIVDPTPEEERAYKRDMREYAKSLHMAMFVNQALVNLEENGHCLVTTLWEMLDAIPYGRSLAEKTFERMLDGPFTGKIGWKSIKSIPRQNYVLVTDAFSNLLGVLAIQPGKSLALYTGLIVDPKAFESYIPIEKLWHCTLRPKTADPRGKSWLRACYEPWYATNIAKPYEVKQLAQFAGESLVIEAPENGNTLVQNLVFPDGTVKAGTTMEQIAAFMAYHGPGATTVLPNGTKVTEIGGTGNGEAFEKFFARKERAKVVAFLSSARSIMESERSSQADAGKAENVLDSIVTGVRQRLCRSFHPHIVQLVVLAFGDSWKKYAPTLSIGSVPQQDWANDLIAIAKGVAGGVITDGMLARVIHERLGLEYVPPKEKETQEREQKKNADAENPKEAGDPLEESDDE